MIGKTTTGKTHCMLKIMASPATNDDRGNPEPLSTGLLAQWVKTSWDKTDGKLVCSSWEKAGLLLLLDGSGKEARVFDISDDDDTGTIGAGDDDDDDEEDVRRGVRPEAGDGSEEVAGAGIVVPAAVDLTC
eukprot:jgi/Undpi1/8201/HiC_scaffold_25.g10671.m1